MFCGDAPFRAADAKLFRGDNRSCGLYGAMGLGVLGACSGLPAGCGAEPGGGRKRVSNTRVPLVKMESNSIVLTAGQTIFIPSYGIP